MKKFLLLLFLFLISVTMLQAQFYIGPHLGFKSSGLKGAIKTTSQGQVNVGNIADAGSTGFTAGLTVGYQVIPAGLYTLDINLDASWTSFSYVEEAYNSLNGAGRFAANGLSGASSNVISIDVMPIHRFNFGSFILSPYAGLGFGLNLMLNSDLSQGPPSQARGSYTGTTEMKMGLVVFYGTLFNASRVIKPFIQFKHLIPFGSETEFTENFVSQQGGGSQSFIYAVSDVPGYFSIAAGVRFTF